MVLICLMMARNAEADIRDLLEDGETGRVETVVDGDTLELGNGIVVRLVGLQAPKLPLGRKGYIPWPMGEDSRLALEKLVAGQTLTLAYGGRRRDRYHRALAHLFDEEGLWIQGEMLRLGMARVYSFSDNRTGVEEMLTIEAAARIARRGIWDHPFYALRDAWSVHRDYDSYQIVEARVVATAKVKGTTYLNFGDNWRTDFTLSVKTPARRIFRRMGIDLLALEGELIRARGWIRNRNGPMIVLSHPEQLEFPAR